MTSCRSESETVSTVHSAADPGSGLPPRPCHVQAAALPAHRPVCTDDKHGNTVPGAWVKLTSSLDDEYDPIRVSAGRTHLGVVVRKMPRPPGTRSGCDTAFVTDW